jgi:hypothetical protein
MSDVIERLEYRLHWKRQLPLRAALAGPSTGKAELAGQPSFLSAGRASALPAGSRADRGDTRARCPPRRSALAGFQQAHGWSSRLLPRG